MDIGERYAWLKMMVDTSFASRFLVSSDGKVIYANPAAQAMFGYTESEFEGKPIDMVFATESNHNLGMPHLAQPIRLLTGDDQEIKGRTKNGAELMMRVGTMPFRTLGGTYLAVTCFDITKYKETERELRFRTTQLEAANKRVSRFAYLVSHDLQEPIRKIASFASLMKIAIADGDLKTALYASDVVHTSASRARSLVASLLDYCLGTAAVLNIEYINVRNEVERVINDLSILVDEAGAKIDDVVPAQLQVKADKAQFTRLINNLITNAIKFHKLNEGPEIVISASRHEGDAGVQLCVSDKGVGFEPKHEKSIFEPFMRLQAATQIPGNGIGLADVKSICERHGWNVEAKSFPGQGATFRVNIPAGEVQKMASGA
jgi:PAS domain S-box-containing protein